ncbi:TWiK family of potassium channels protein 7-like [Centruroides vittatus]|uniref:TWiK family of potassium channels protein 7-like n=1 Tax=Centruroides vittatus TaxID=120091 RepID=UPI003510C222
MARRKDRTSNKGRPGHTPKKEPHKSSRCMSCCRRFSTLLFSHVGLCALVVGYSIMGAFTFRALEAPHEKEKHQEVSKIREQTVKRLWDITYDLNVLYKENWTKLVTDEIKRFQKELVAAVKGGYDGKDVATNQQWTFSGAFLYSLTILTTIGYGNIAPKTKWGKLMTIAYAIFGIPLMFLYLTNVGNILAKTFKYIYGKLCNRNNKNKQRRRKPPIEQYQIHHIVLRDNTPNAHNSIDPSLPTKFNVAYEGDHKPACLRDEPQEDMEIPQKIKVSVPIYLCVVIITCYICGGAGIFSIWEGWNYLDGSYFCFVTLSTIGFGDLVPGYTIASDSGTQEKLIICSLYLLGGMALIAMCFNLVQEEVVNKVRTVGKKMGIMKDDEEVED